MSRYCSLLHIWTYASFLSLILEAAELTVIMLLKWCVLPTLFSGKNAKLSSSFRCAFSVTALSSLQNGARLKSEHFAFNALFLWEHSLCAPEGAERRWAASGENSWNGQTWRGPLWTFKQKMALTLRPPPQVYCSPSSAQTNVIIKPV